MLIVCKTTIEFPTYPIINMCNYIYYNYYFVIVCFWLDSPPSGPWLPHSRGFYITHNDAPQSVGLLWTSDQFVA